MRNPERINRVIESIRRVWHLVPDWRLGQLLCNLSREVGTWNSFFVEDDLLEAAALNWLDKAEKEEKYERTMMVRKTFPNVMDAVAAAEKECDESFEIRKNKDGTYELIYMTEDKGDLQ